MQLPSLSEGLARLRAVRSRIDPAAFSRFTLASLAAPGTAAGIVRTGAGLCLARLQYGKKSIIATHAGYVSLPPGAGPEETAAAAVERLKAWGGVESAVFGVDFGATVVRHLRFPFGGQRQIKAVVPHEFAENSLLPLHEYCLAHTAPHRTPEGKFSITAAAVKREDVIALTRAFSERGLALRALAPACAALSFLRPEGTNSRGTEQPGIVPEDAAAQEAVSGDPGDKRNVCVVYTDEAGEAYTLLGRGGVEAVLCLPPGEGGLDRFAGRIAFFVEQAGPVERVLLMAGNEAISASRMRRLSAMLGLPVEKAGAPRHIALDAVGDAPEGAALAASLAASLFLPQPETDINFLTGALAPASDAPTPQGPALKVCAAACLVIASLCVLEVAQGIRERSALRPLRQELFRTYREALPDVDPTTPMAVMERIMEDRLRERRLAERARAGTKEKTALDILTAVHQALLPDMQGVAESMTLSQEQFTLSGTVADFKVADTIREKLAALPLFEDVRLQNVQRGERQRVRYEIEGKIRLPEHDRLP